MAADRAQDALALAVVGAEEGLAAYGLLGELGLWRVAQEEDTLAAEGQVESGDDFESGLFFGGLEWGRLFGHFFVVAEYQVFGAVLGKERVYQRGLFVYVY